MIQYVLCIVWYGTSWCCIVYYLVPVFWMLNSSELATHRLQISASLPYCFLTLSWHKLVRKTKPVHPAKYISDLYDELDGKEKLWRSFDCRQVVLPHGKSIRTFQKTRSNNYETSIISTSHEKPSIHLHIQTWTDCPQQSFPQFTFHGILTSRDLLEKSRTTSTLEVHKRQSYKGNKYPRVIYKHS